MRVHSAVSDWLPLFLLPLVAAILFMRASNWLFMCALAGSLFLGCKWVTWRQARNAVANTRWKRSLAYFFAWPGMDAKTFLTAHRDAMPPRSSEWALATIKTMLGLMILWAAARTTTLPPLLTGWLGILGLLLFLHFGSFELLALAWRQVGVSAAPLMRSPLFATSLGDFWSQRWNTAFNALASRFVFRPVVRCFGVFPATLAAFLVSGLIHELVISVPARGGYGLPTGYFLVQGLATLFERSRYGRELRLSRGFQGWLFVLICTAGPAFWLFHPPFVLNIILPMVRYIGATGNML
jgi:hypothetical protein